VSEEDKNYMITQEGCGHCEMAQEKLQEKIIAGKIEILPVETPKGLELADKYQVDATPTILHGKNDDSLQKCYLSKDLDKIMCDDGTEKVL